MPGSSQEISVVAKSNLDLPFKLVFISPSGLALQTIEDLPKQSSRIELQALNHFLGQGLRSLDLALLISCPADANANIAMTFEDIGRSDSAAAHPKSFIADARYFLWRR